eukprot:Awhi_evm1s6479
MPDILLKTPPVSSHGRDWAGANFENYVEYAMNIIMDTVKKITDPEIPKPVRKINLTTGTVKECWEAKSLADVDLPLKYHGAPGLGKKKQELILITQAKKEKEAEKQRKKLEQQQSFQFQNETQQQKNNTLRLVSCIYDSRGCKKMFVKKGKSLENHQKICNKRLAPLTSIKTTTTSTNTIQVTTVSATSATVCNPTDFTPNTNTSVTRITTTSNEKNTANIATTTNTTTNTTNTDFNIRTNPVLYSCRYCSKPFVKKGANLAKHE